MKRCGVGLLFDVFVMENLFEVEIGFCVLGFGYGLHRVGRRGIKSVDGAD